MKPLAEQLRPKTVDEIVGQEHLLGEQGVIRRSMEKGQVLSMIFWGPPGCGKTTLALAYAKAFDAEVISLSAVSSGIADLKKVVERIKSAPLFNKTTILFVDEIHRYHKGQQDFLLPYLEKGIFYLIGATTENPSFSLNNALLSRMRVFTLNPLGPSDQHLLLQRYEKSRPPLPLNDEGREYLVQIAQGDGRYLLNLVENITACSSQEILEMEELKKLLQQRRALYDKGGEEHYNLISALHKSVRGSDPDAALYWLCRMLEGGEDPLFILRRLIRMATEDVGLADPQALQIALNARDAYQMLGSPEGELVIAEAIIYMALAPKSNAIYTAYKQAKKMAAETNHLPPPRVILNAPRNLHRSIDVKIIGAQRSKSCCVHVKCAH